MPCNNNPYNFVPILWNTPPARERPIGHEKFNGKSGIITCELVAETPIFIPSTFDGDIIKQNNRRIMKEFCYRAPGHPKTKIIPGSSLKGVIRSVAEAVANSCLSQFAEIYGNNANYANYITDDFRPCSDINNLCITCRMFGMLSSQTVFKGKINFEEATIQGEYQELDITLPFLATPKPHHGAFYIVNERIAGRKFYYHSTQIITAQSNASHSSAIKPLATGATFIFNVDFENLTDEEYKLLLYSLVLEEDMRHKIGMGKPVGLGSVKISITQIRLLNNERELESIGNLEEHIEQHTQEFRNNQDANMNALRNIWHWPPENNRRYPSREWFNTHPHEPLGNP